MHSETTFMYSAIQHIPHMSIKDLMWSFLGHSNATGLKNEIHLKALGNKIWSDSSMDTR